MTKPEKRQRALIDWCVQHRMGPDELDPVALRIKNAYRELRMRFADAYCPSKKQADAWNDAAMACIEAQAEPESWVAAQFSEDGVLPYPNNLHGPEACARWDKWLTADGEMDITLQLASYADIVNTWRKTQAVSQILQDPRHGFPPVFVWCIAQLCGLSKLADVVADAARRQLARPAYWRVYSANFKDIIHLLTGDNACT